MEEISSSLKVARALKEVKDSVRQNIEHHFREMQLTGPQGMLIGALGHYGKMKVSDLSEKLGLSNSTVSGIVDRLEKQGLVERVRSEEDRRVVYVDVTSETRKAFHKHFENVEKTFEAMLSKATAEELSTILEGLATLKKVLDRQKQQ